MEMRDLLADNVALHGQLEDLHGSAPLAAIPPLPQRDTVAPFMDVLLCSINGSTVQRPSHAEVAHLQSPHYTGGTPSRGKSLAGV